MTAFKQHLEAQQFEQAATAFDQLTAEQKAEALKALYYQSREAKTPVAVSVLRRQLHDGKQFDDFYNAWMPPAESLNPMEVDGITYYQHFECPMRMINATNLEDPNDIITVCLTWCTQEELMQGMEEIQNDPVNAQRAKSIGKVADKRNAELFITQSDTRLGN